MMYFQIIMRFNIVILAVVLAFDVIIVANSDFIGTWLGSFECKNVTYNVRLDIINVETQGGQLQGKLNYWNDETMVSGSHEVKGIFSRDTNTFTLLGIKWIKQPAR
ncbi:unnamed protein product [Owenia fusiformis]|uniref:Uncharacterized protein n=1 Tax=Owenia fusiformis TaxID=6347 RepID=A0A8S4NYY9_OWEFU|nr:unnamed protein product [Owenia fusiformis]